MSYQVSGYIEFKNGIVFATRSSNLFNKFKILVPYQVMSMKGSILFLISIAPIINQKSMKSKSKLVIESVLTQPVMN